MLSGLLVTFANVIAKLFNSSEYFDYSIKKAPRKLVYGS